MLSLVLLAALAVSPTTGNLTVVCDTPFALYVDGHQVNQANVRTSWTTYDLNAGRHDIRVEAWPSPFRSEQLAAGIVDVPGGSEVRLRAEKDRLVVYETLSLLSTAPQGVVAVAPANVQVTMTAPAPQVILTVPAPQVVLTAPTNSLVVETQYSEQRGVEDHERRRHEGHGRDGRGGGHGDAMRPSDFQALKGALSDESFEQKRLDVLATAAAANRFTVEQVGQVVDLFDFSDGKVKAVELCNPQIVDRENAFQLYSHLTFEADKQRVRSILDR